MALTRLDRMKLGRRAAYLRRCIRVAKLLEMYETDCTIRKRIFEKHIQPVAHCSYTTFNNMLNETNPRKELESIMNMLNNEEL